MTINKLKKQSKNLLHLLPEFVREHPAELRLADCQELVARMHGYPNWHSAAARAEQPPSIETGAKDDVEILVQQKDGKTTARMGDMVMETPGDDADARSFLTSQMQRIRELERKSEEAHAAGIPALKRLYEVAQGHSGQCRHIAAFLLGLYNGGRFPFDLTDLRCIDKALLGDCLLVLEMDAAPKREVHTYFPDGGKRFEELARRWGIPDVRRLKGICEQLTKYGVSSFGSEAKLAAEIEHATANTWPD